MGLARWWIDDGTGLPDEVSRDRLSHKLLRGQALPDMSGLPGKVAEYCGNRALKRSKSANFFEIGPKFLAVQRHTF